MKPLDLFISHSSADVEVARELRAVLDEAGYASFMAPDDVIGTDTWTAQILDAIERSRAMIVLVSARANQSNHVSREVSLALGRGRPVLPVRIERVGPEGSLEYLLSLVQWTDAFPPPIKAYSATILRRVEATLQAADGTEAVPDETVPDKVPDETAPDDRPGAPSGALEAGASIGGFTIVEKIGEGGQATIYRAHQAKPRRDVALKVIRADQREDATYRTRFIEEQDTLAGLEHPSIVPVYAAGAEESVLFIAMRLIDGPDLGARLRASGPLSPGETAGILRPIAAALDFAHQHGVIHRDVKPSNILIDSGGLPYLSDFGLGKRSTGGPEISEPGLAIGTLEYMAPEQFATGVAATITPAADVYALGCVAYACLTGRPPFRADTPERTMYAHINEPVPSLAGSRPDLPPAIDAVLARALAKAPAQRFETAVAFVEALAVAGASEQTRPIPVPPPTTPTGRAETWVRANRPLAAIGGVLGVIILVLAGSAVLDDGDGNGPTATPRRTTVAQTTAPTATPRPATPAPTRTPVADLFPNAAELQLIASLPQGPGFQDGCERYLNRYTGTTAGISCDDPSGGTAPLFYQSWPDKASMDRMYQSVLDSAKVARTGQCKNGAPAHTYWTLVEGGDRLGELACYEEPRAPGRVSYFWTHDPSLVMTFWSAPSNDEGFQFWGKWARAPR